MSLGIRAFFMIQNPRIVFFGTPEFAVTSLKSLVAKGFNVVAVVTAPDKPAGRGLKLKSSPVCEFAKTVNIPVLQPLYMKAAGFLAELSSFSPDLQIVIAFRMLPGVVWALPAYGTFNLHASLLPDYRGAAPINRAIMNGEKETGLTTFFINDQIDTGKIILSRRFPIGDTETAGELHDRLMVEGAGLVVETVERIRLGTVKEVDQKTLFPESLTLKTAPKIFKDDCRIDWDQPVEAVFNLIRGLCPHPGAFTSFTGSDRNIHDLKILVAIPEKFEHDLKPGTFIKKEKVQLMIAVCDGWLNVQELQLQGRKVMKTADFMRGYGTLFSEIQEI
jgi:methionyl-tRNA formyltransferase